MNDIEIQHSICKIREGGVQIWDFCFQRREEK